MAETSSDGGEPSQPRLHTARLSITMPDPDAADSVLAYLQLNAARFAAGAPPGAPPTVERVRAALAAARAEHAQQRGVRMYMFRREDLLVPIGDIALSEIIRGPFQACFLGYRLGSDHEGRGFATEAVCAVVAYAFEVLKLHRVMANYEPTNARSGRVLRRAGFVVEGYARDYLLLGGAWRDHVLTSISNPNWSQP